MTAPSRGSARDRSRTEDARGAQLLARSRHPDPFTFLGRHPSGGGVVVRAYIPDAESVRVGEDGPTLERVGRTGLFVWRGPSKTVPKRYELVWRTKDGATHRSHDPYAFHAETGGFDRHVFGQGHHWHLHRFLGAVHRTEDGVPGVFFATWAPRARRVGVVGDFNAWDGRRHPMRKHPGGIWDLFVPGVEEGARYKFAIGAASGRTLLKADPFGRQMELRPRTASVVAARSRHVWKDAAWIEARAKRDWRKDPISVYEVHLGSWRRGEKDRWLGYRESAERLAAYVLETGFTHVELMPVMEHPYDGSWGYQTLGYYAPTSRFGSPDDFRAFVDTLHAAGIGVLLDWTPAHFPSDAHGLAKFDGTPLYEHGDPRRGRHPDWGTLIFDYGRPEVCNFLMGSALCWLEEFHVDGLRVDAVASMLYLDYSRRAGEWLPNARGGRENLDAVRFLQEMNSVVQDRHPGVLMVAEESTTWPLVTRETSVGGLGFSMKWNMGWMHDTLDYLALDPIHRKYHHGKMTFGVTYAHAEAFVLAFSHDEVVHGKGSLLAKMHGDLWRKFAQLRLLFAYQWTFPGKKLLFMGQEFGSPREWAHDRSLDWSLLDEPRHRGVQRLVTDLNRLYADRPALHRGDFDPQGFRWIDCHDMDHSVFSYERRDGDTSIVVVLNFTPVPRRGYRIGLPEPGLWREVLNTDAEAYGGSNVGNLGEVVSEAKPWMGRSQSAAITVPPLAALVLERAP